MKLINIGIIGYAGIAKRSIIPALFLMPDKYNVKAIASRDKENKSEIENKLKIGFYHNYESLIQDKDINAIYIPLPNSLHAKWIEKALENNLHILVEKPLACNLDDIKRLNKIAAKKNLVLIENFQFRFHKQLSIIKNLLEQNKIGEIRCLRSSFGFPPFDDSNNIRYSKKLGGGALLDAGVYPIKISSIFFNDDISALSSTLFYDKSLGVDIWGGGYLVQENGNLFSQIAFGFDNYYQCNLEIWGSKGKIIADRIFTAPPEEKQIIRLQTPNSEKNIEIPPDNHFVNMFHHFYNLIFTKKEREKEYRQNILQGKLVQEMRDNSYAR
ncbi:MAG: Gfo/Idh/MocA family protein [Candidatus Neomarinimicrobiota bacterium]